MDKQIQNIRIRTAAASDAEAILAVYAPYIRNTAITFEYELPRLEEFRERITCTLKRHPYLVAERSSEILGYAYASPFIGRTATDRSAEVSIYLREDTRGLGLGRRLYQTLEDISRAQNILNLNASIAVSEGEDPYVTRTRPRPRCVSSWDWVNCWKNGPTKSPSAIWHSVCR